MLRLRFSETTRISLVKRAGKYHMTALSELVTCFKRRPRVIMLRGEARRVARRV
jgi:hypothetical protein